MLPLAFPAPFLRYKGLHNCSPPPLCAQALVPTEAISNNTLLPRFNHRGSLPDCKGCQAPRLLTQRHFWYLRDGAQCHRRLVPLPDGKAYSANFCIDYPPLYDLL